MRRCLFLSATAILLGLVASVAEADESVFSQACTGDCCRETDHRQTCASGCRPSSQCVPACKPRYEEKKVKKPLYSMKCDYACYPDREPWHEDACDPEHNPPCGKIYIKKKLLKSEEETVEKVLQYDVVMVPAKQCRCSSCKPHCGDRWHELKVACAQFFGYEQRLHPRGDRE